MITIKKAKKKGLATISVTDTSGHTGHDQEAIEAGDQTVDGSQQCIVHVELGNTANMGNYNSAKFSVGISMPCDLEDIDATYVFCQDWVDKKLVVLNNEAKEYKE